MMDNLEKKCEHCGATYIVSDGYCKQCWKRIPTTASPKEELLDGVKKADWHFFIDKNASRYVDIYAKNEGKKFFLSWNWAAFFFGFNWLCYRKMYKFACLYIIVDLILAIILTAVGVGIYAPKLEPHYQNVTAYEEAVGVDTLTQLNPVYSAETSVLLDKALDSQKEIERIALKIGGISSISMLLCGILFGIFADSIYKIHILKNIKYTDGGTSILAFFVGCFAYRTIYSLLVSPLISLLMDMVF